MAAGRGKVRKVHMVLLFLLLLLSAAVLLVWGNATVQTERFTFSSSRLPAGFDGCTAVHLSDLHGAVFGRDNMALLHAVAKAEPDYIFLTGDLVDEQTEDPLDYAASLGGGLAALAPTFYITGNHEWALGTERVKELKGVLEGSGVIVLSNAAVPLERGGDAVVLAGIDDPNGFADQKTPETVAAELYAAYGAPFWLLLAHRNTLFEAQYSRLGADLTLSGHAHGGVWRLPFTDGLIDTNMNWFPSYTSGFYRCGEAELFVSRGLGNSPRAVFRLLNRPQVAVITLQRGST